MIRYFKLIIPLSFILFSLFACSKDGDDVVKVESARMFSRIHSLSAPENMFLSKPESSSNYYLSFFHYEAWIYMKEKMEYKGINGFHYVTRGMLSVGEGDSKLLDSISTSHYGENEPFVEGQDSIAQAQLIYRLKSIKVIHVDKTTKEETDVSKDFTISYWSYEKYMKVRPKKMENISDYIYAITKPLSELNEEDCKWLGWNTDPTRDIYLNFIHKYSSYEPNFYLIIEGNDREMRFSISGIKWMK